VGGGVGGGGGGRPYLFHPHSGDDLLFSCEAGASCALVNYWTSSESGEMPREVSAIPGSVSLSGTLATCLQGRELGSELALWSHLNSSAFELRRDERFGRSLRHA